MRDPKTHAKVLAERSQAVERAWRDAFDKHDRPRRIRIGRLITRLEKMSDLHYISTGWRYIIEGYGTAYWQHTEVIPDTEEEA